MVAAVRTEPEPPSGVWSVMRTSSPWLIAVVLLHLALILPELVALVLDSRTVGGISPWIKPLKFNLSIAVYAATMAWVLSKLPPGLRSRIAFWIGITMCVETACIALQAVRGVQSHFNVGAPLDGRIFSLMGLAIAFNTYLVLRTLIHFVRGHAVGLDRLTEHAVMLGLFSLLLGSLVGGYMSAVLRHAVGVPDGGPGLPLVNWSTQGGDLRIAHFWGLHGIQLLLLTGYVLARRPGFSPRLRLGVLYGIFAVHSGLMIVLFALAMYGIPLWRIGE